MKKLLVLTLLSFFFASSSYSQLSKIDIGGNLGTNYFIGDSPLFDSQISPNLGIYTYYQHSPKLAFKLQVGYGQLRTKLSGLLLKTSMIPVEFITMYSLLNSKKFEPFVHAGFGVINFTLNNSPRFYDGMILGGGGFKMPISPKFSFLLTADLRYTTGDDFNGVTGGSLKDGYFSLNGGLTYHLSKPQTFEKKPSTPKAEIIAAGLEPGSSPTLEKKDGFLEIIQMRSKIKKYNDELASKIAQIEELKILAKIKKQRISQYETQIAELRSNPPGTIFAEKTIKGPTKQFVETVEEKTPAVKTVSSKPMYTVKQRYNQAMKNFKNRNYRSAITLFTDLSNKYPNHNLASNFIYWIGESYVGLKNYSSAIEAFNNVNKYKQSPKHDDALLMSGISLLRSGDSGKAKEKFEELLQKYPDGEYSGRAERYLQTINAQIIS